MKSRILCYSALALLTLAGSCKKEEGPGDGWTSGGNIQFQNSSNSAPLQSQTFSATASPVFTSARGIRLTFTAPAFRHTDGTPVTTGDVTLDFKEYFSNPDFINSFVSTVTKDDRLLQSGGAFYLSAHQGPLPLLFNNPVQVRVPDFGSPSATHRLYHATEVANVLNKLPWIPSSKAITTSAGFYNFEIDSFNWWNVAQVPPTAGALANINVSLPSGCGGLNTMALMVLPDRGIAYFNVNSYAKILVSPTVPADLPVKLLVISRKENKLQYHLQDLTTRQNLNYGVPGFTPATDAELFNVIQGL